MVSNFAIALCDKLKHVQHPIARLQSIGIPKIQLVRTKRDDGRMTLLSPVFPRTSGSFLYNLLHGRRKLHLAPPFLVHDHVPRYHRLRPDELERKKEESIRHLKQCNICPRYGWPIDLSLMKAVAM